MTKFEQEHDKTYKITTELPHDKTNEMICAPIKDSDQPGHPPVWSGSSLSAWRKLGSLATQWAHREDSDRTERLPMLIRVFDRRTDHFFGFVTRRLMCAERRSSTQSDQSSLSTWRRSGFLATIKHTAKTDQNRWRKHTAKTLIRLGRCSGWSESLLVAHHIFGFYMLQLKYALKYQSNVLLFKFFNSSL